MTQAPPSTKWGAVSFCLPQNLSSGIIPDTGVSAFEREVAAEKAASLGRAGKKLERCLAALRSNEEPAQRDHLLHEAADAAHAYLIQRELCGLTDHRVIVEDYDIPREVVARVGARRQGNP